MALQELKTETAAFPRAEIEAAGYGCLVAGQKTWNGVALLSKGVGADRKLSHWLNFESAPTRAELRDFIAKREQGDETLALHREPGVRRGLHQRIHLLKRSGS